MRRDGRGEGGSTLPRRSLLSGRDGDDGDDLRPPEVGEVVDLRLSLLVLLWWGQTQNQNVAQRNGHRETDSTTLASLEKP